MNTYKVINVEKLPEIFEAFPHPLKKKDCNYCMMAAVLYPKPFLDINSAIDEGFEYNYVCGIMNGWDEQSGTLGDKTSIMYKLGLNHGEIGRKLATI